MSDSVAYGWLDLSGRVCVVTGAGSGIGFAVAEQLLQAGMRVAMLDKNIEGCEPLIDLYKEHALAVSADVADEAAVNGFFSQVKTQFGNIYGLVNCAGFVRPAGLVDVEIDEWNAVINTNLTGALICARNAIPQMIENGQGSLVHISSVAALYPQTWSGAYSASKAGVTLMSRQLAAEHGANGIRSNSICPGMIRTALSEKFYLVPGIEDKRKAMTASRRIGKPADIANTAAFLLSERSSYINGTELTVDGGMGSMLMDLIPRPGFSD